MALNLRSRAGAGWGSPVDEEAGGVAALPLVVVQVELDGHALADAARGAARQRPVTQSAARLT